MFSLGNVGTSCDHALASADWVASVSRSARFTEANVNSRRYLVSDSHGGQMNEQPTGLPLAARIGDVCAEYDVFKEGSKRLRITCSQLLLNCTQ
jgi:hypothetical protein